MIITIRWPLVWRTRYELALQDVTMYRARWQAAEAEIRRATQPVPRPAIVPPRAARTTAVRRDPVMEAIQAVAGTDSALRAYLGQYARTRLTDGAEPEVVTAELRDWPSATGDEDVTQDTVTGAEDGPDLTDLTAEA